MTTSYSLGKISVTYNGSSGLLLSNKKLEKVTDLSHSYTLKGRPLAVRSVSVTPNNRYLIITYSRSPKIRVVDLLKLEFLPHKYDVHEATVRLVATSNNDSFYTASWDGQFYKIDLLTGKSKLLFSGSRSPSVFLDSSQKYLFVAEYPDFDVENRYIGKCYDLQKHQTKSVYKHLKERTFPESVDIASDLNHVYTGGEGVVYKWNLTGKEPIHTFFDCSCGIRKIAVSKTIVAAASNDGLIRTYYKTGKFYKNFRVSNYEVKDVKIAQDESFIIGCSDNGTIKSWSLKTGKEIYFSKIHTSVIWSICLCKNDTLLITGGIDGIVNFINAHTGKVVFKMFNLPLDNEMLITVPREKKLPNGLFFTSNKDFIKVFTTNEKGDQIVLEKEDNKRLAYINSLNCKNLILLRLKNEKSFNLLSDNYLKNRKSETPSLDNKFPKYLGSKV